MAVHAGLGRMLEPHMAAKDSCRRRLHPEPWQCTGPSMVARSPFSKLNLQSIHLIKPLAPTTKANILDYTHS